MNPRIKPVYGKCPFDSPKSELAVESSERPLRRVVESDQCGSA